MPRDILGGTGKSHTMKIGGTRRTKRTATSPAETTSHGTGSGMAMLGWIVAAVLAVVLIAMLL